MIDDIVNYFGYVAYFTSLVKGDELALLNSLSSAFSVLPLRWRLWSWLFTSLLTSSACKVAGLGRCLECHWLISYSASNGQSHWFFCLWGKLVDWACEDSLRACCHVLVLKLVGEHRSLGAQPRMDTSLCSQVSVDIRLWAQPHVHVGHWT